MVNTRAPTPESEPRVQHIENLEDAPNLFPRPTHSSVPVPGLGIPSASTPRSGTLPPVRPSRHTPNAPPATRIINLTGYICQLGHRKYAAAAKAAGVTDKSPVYWFHENAYENWGWDDMGYSARHLQDAERKSYSEKYREMLNGHRIAREEAKVMEMQKKKRVSGAAVEEVKMVKEDAELDKDQPSEG
jgi:hypothetical protein